jgi:hypothetical protein
MGIKSENSIPPRSLSGLGGMEKSSIGRRSSLVANLQTFGLFPVTLSFPGKKRTEIPLIFPPKFQVESRWNSHSDST